MQKECVGTESKSETEALLRKAKEDYEAKKFVARSENITVGALLDKANTSIRISYDTRSIPIPQRYAESFRGILSDDQTGPEKTAHTEDPDTRVPSPA